MGRALDGFGDHRFRQDAHAARTDCRDTGILLARPAQVGDGFDNNARIQQVEHNPVSVSIGREHNSAIAGLDRQRCISRCAAVPSMIPGRSLLRNTAGGPRRRRLRPQSQRHEA